MMVMITDDDDICNSDDDDDDDDDDNDDDNDDDDDEEQKWHCGRLRGETWVKTQPLGAVWNTLQCGKHCSVEYTSVYPISTPE